MAFGDFIVIPQNLSDAQLTNLLIERVEKLTKFCQKNKINVKEFSPLTNLNHAELLLNFCQITFREINITAQDDFIKKVALELVEGEGWGATAIVCAAEDRRLSRAFICAILGVYGVLPIEEEIYFSKS